MNMNDILLNLKNFANKQDKNDSRLLTNSKDVVGAINENKSSLEETKNEVVSLDNSKLEKDVAETTYAKKVELLDKATKQELEVERQRITEVANNGTTVEVIERATKEEINRQIDDGRLSNMTIEDYSITKEKLNYNTKNDIECTTAEVEKAFINVDKLTHVQNIPNVIKTNGSIRVDQNEKSIIIDNFNLDTYYVKVTSDTNIYFDKSNYEDTPSGSPLPYVTIAFCENCGEWIDVSADNVLKKITGTKVSTRYSSRDNNLPTVINPLNIPKNSMICFTVTKGATNMKLHGDFFKQLSPSVELTLAGKEGNSPFLPMSQKDTKDLINGANIKKGMFKYINKSGNGDSTERLDIYFPSTNNGFVKYKFVHSINVESKANNWRIQDAYQVDDSLANEVKLTSQGEWECAVKLEGRPDFSGGILHGDCEMESIHFFIDGKQITDLSSYNNLTEFSEIKAVQYLNLYDPSNPQTLIANNGMCHIFDVKNKNQVTIKQALKWAGEFSLSSCYMAMFPISKEYSSQYFLDTEYKINQASNILVTDYVKEATIIEQSKNFIGRFGINIYPTKEKTYHFRMTDNGGLPYNKCYYCVATSGKTSTNELWQSESYFNLTI